MRDKSDGGFLINTEAIQSKKDFVVFVKMLLQDYKDNRKEWENNTLELFLDGLAGFTEDIEGYYSNRGIGMDLEKPSWRVFADVLLAARVYE